MPEKEEKHMTLDRLLVQSQRSHPGASGELTRVIVQMGVVAKVISSYVRRAALEGLLGYTGEVNVQGEEVKKLDELGNTAFVEAFEYVDIIGALVSEERDQPMSLSSDKRREKYVVLVDPIDGSPNLDVDCLIGSIFSIRSLKGAIEESILQKGTEQIAAGYIMYGPSVLLVYSAADGVHSFVLDEEIGEFVLDHESIRMPDRGTIISANFGNYSKWNGRLDCFLIPRTPVKETATLCAIAVRSLPIYTRFSTTAVFTSTPEMMGGQKANCDCFTSVRLWR